MIIDPCTVQYIMHMQKLNISIAMMAIYPMLISLLFIFFKMEKLLKYDSE